MAVERQSSTLPPAQPSYVLRGHAAQIHSVQFVRQNTRLITGDADGWVIYWKLETKRALAVWKAHDGAILGTAEWGCDNVITHGRDNSLRIWQVRTADEPTFSTALPADTASANHTKPWLLHTLPVNTLNFCAFSMCYAHTREEVPKCRVQSTDSHPASSRAHAAILVAVPARDDKKAEVYQFPDERLKYVVPRAQSTDTGMVMAVKLVQQPKTQQIMVITGYEGGLTAIHLLPRDHGSMIGVAQLLYLSQPHTQPILSLDASPDARMYFTSGADAVIAAHRVPDLPSDEKAVDALPVAQEVDGEFDVPVDTQTFKLSPRTESDIETTGDSNEGSPADDPPISVPDDTTEPPLSFAKRPIPISNTQSQPSTLSAGGLSSLLFTAPSSAKGTQPPRPPPVPKIQAPHKVNNTKHAGQQSLSVRSDGRLLATGGWDSRVRIYSTKTLKEVAVLKWHKEGVYAVSFGEVLGPEDLRAGPRGEAGNEANGEITTKRETGLSKLQKQREERMQLKHWVAAAAKDGKVSLWEVF